jgi:DNA replication protein DnaC
LYLNGLISRSGKQGLLLMGNVGVGKTYFMCAMLIELLKNKKQCLFINMPEFYHQLKSNFTDEGTPEYSRLISQAKEIEILAIDELAQKKLSSWAQEELYGIINYRYNQQLPLMATTSSTDEKLKSYISADIIDRLYEICLAYKISGPSLRPGRKF